MIIDGLIVVVLLGAVNKEAIDLLAHVACRFFPEDIFILPWTRVAINGRAVEFPEFRGTPLSRNYPALAGRWGTLIA